MTVGELISRLSAYAPDVAVCAETGENGISLVTDLFDVGLGSGRGTVILKTARSS